MGNFRRSVIVDSGFWFGLLDPRDQYHSRASSIVSTLDSWNVLLPWPILYEVVNTTFVKHTKRVAPFEAWLRKSHVTKIDDAKYRDAALAQALSWSKVKKREISLVDMVIRFLLDDVNVKTDAILTFNQKDFHDVCMSRQVELLPHSVGRT